MVSFLIHVGKGMFSPDDAITLLKAKDRSLIPNMVRACGLYFLSAEYPPELDFIESNDATASAVGAADGLNPSATVADDIIIPKPE